MTLPDQKESMVTMYTEWTDDLLVRAHADMVIMSRNIQRLIDEFPGKQPELPILVNSHNATAKNFLEELEKRGVSADLTKHSGNVIPVEQ